MFVLAVFNFGVEKTSQSAVCRVVSVLLHYFLLSSFLWMSVEAINMYRFFVVVLRRGSDYKFFIAASIVAWGMLRLSFMLMKIDTYVPSYT